MIPTYALLPILVTDHLTGSAPQLARLHISAAFGVMAGNHPAKDAGTAFLNRRFPGNRCNADQLSIAGPVSDSIGVQYWFLIVGAFTTILSTISYFVPAIMNIENA